MKRFILSLCCAVLGVALLVGCQSNGNNNSVAGSSGKVVILFGKPPKPYTVVGTVSALKSQPNPGDTWQSALQKQAAARGADAVMVDTATIDNSTANVVSGTAIKYQQ